MKKSVQKKVSGGREGTEIKPYRPRGFLTRFYDFMERAEREGTATPVSGISFTPEGYGQYYESLDFEDDPVKSHLLLYATVYGHHAPKIVAGVRHILDNLRPERGEVVVFVNRDAKLAEVAAKTLIRKGEYPGIDPVKQIKTVTVSRKAANSSRLYDYIRDRGILQSDEEGNPVPVVFVDVGKQGSVLAKMTGAVREKEGDSREITNYMYLYNNNQKIPIKGLLAVGDGETVTGRKCIDEEFQQMTKWVEDFEHLPKVAKHVEDGGIKEFTDKEDVKHLKSDLEPGDFLGWVAAKQAVIERALECSDTLGNISLMPFADWDEIKQSYSAAYSQYAQMKLAKSPRPEAEKILKQAGGNVLEMAQRFKESPGGSTGWGLINFCRGDPFQTLLILEYAGLLDSAMYDAERFQGSQFDKIITLYNQAKSGEQDIDAVRNKLGVCTLEQKISGTEFDVKWGKTKGDYSEGVRVFLKR